jgi:hypothetical protein
MRLPQVFIDFFRSLRCKAWQVRHFFSARQLRSSKKYQKPAFLSLRKNFAGLYKTLSSQPIAEFVTPPWHHYNSRVESAFLPVPPFAFLLNPVVLETMFVTRGGVCLHEELRFLKLHCSQQVLAKSLQEDYAGCPIIYNSEYCTSHNSIHHLYHAVLYQQTLHSDLSDVNTVIEWGAGYGNFGKILQRYLGRDLTFIMIDTPLFSCIQWLYLSAVLGVDKVTLHTQPNMPIEKDKFNLMPLASAKNRVLHADMFVSTWALSESSRYSQDYVVEHQWFNCAKLLLAFQESTVNLPDAGRIRQLALGAGCSIHPIEFMAGNSYAFR